MIEYLPLLCVVAVLGALAVIPLAPPVDRAVGRIAMVAFGDYARSREPNDGARVELLRAAHVPHAYVAYASRTYLYTGLAVLVGSVLGVYLVAAVLLVLATGAVPRVPAVSTGSLGPWTMLGAHLAGGALLGGLAGASVSQLRWGLVRYRANERARAIDDTIQRNIAFLFALSRSGMAFTKTLRILADNRRVYGETAREFAVTVNDIEFFGQDLTGALRRTAERTPSAELQEFTENLSSVLQSGQSVSDFLRGEYEYYQDEAESAQSRFLDLLSTLAEAYVTIFVAGPLFLITILVVIGLVIGGTLGFLRSFAYLVIPLGTVGFLVYLDTITTDVTFSRDDAAAERYGRTLAERPEDADALADGGNPANRARLRAHERLAPLRDALDDPLGTILERPVRILAATVPVALVYAIARWVPALSGIDLSAASLLTSQTQAAVLAAIDGPLVQATLFVLGTFALVWEVHARRKAAIERAVPDFLDRFASTNEAGMAVVTSLRRVANGDLGGLSEELSRTRADVEWGAHVERALDRLESRARIATMTRVVALTTNAMRATNDIGPVLRIAADEAKAARRLKRERRSELATYLVVIYLSFFVFLAIIVALDVIFVPAIPTASSFASGASGPIGNLGNLTQKTKDAYSLLFFHTSLVQAVCSGLVAGKMGADDVRSGAKHAFAMLLVAYIIFVVFA